jgi:hypothetical protein
MPPTPPLVTPSIGLRLFYYDRDGFAFGYAQRHTVVLNLKRDTDSRRLNNEGSQCEYISFISGPLRPRLSFYSSTRHSSSDFNGSSHKYISRYQQVTARQTRHESKMKGCSPIDADRMPGTSRFFTSEKSSCVPPPYPDQQAPSPYVPCRSDTAKTQPSTRSVPFGPGVTFEWQPNVPTTPDDIIIITVQTNWLGRRQSFDDPLPERYAFTIVSSNCRTY